MNDFLVAGIIVLQVIGYGLGAYVLFDEKNWNRTVPLIALILSMVSYIVCGVGLDNLIFMTFAAISIFCTMLKGTWKHRIVIAIKTVFIVICFEEMLESVVVLILQLTDRPPLPALILFIVAEILLLGMWLIIKRQKRRGWKLPNQCTSMLLKVALGILAAALLLIIAGIDYAEPYVNKESFSIMGKILSVLSYLGIVILGIFIIYVKNSNDNYKELLELEGRLRISQQHYYEMLLEREEETRKFRHDISNHIICLKEIVEGGNLTVAKDYLSDMNWSISQIHKKHFFTGNDIIDAIVNYYVQELDEDVTLSVKGVCLHSLEISNMDLCSIISNLMQNAIDALHNQQTGEKYLHTRLSATQDAFELKVCNSMEEEPILDASGLPVTSKMDTRNHGIGLKNVKKVVEQVNGIFHINIKNKEFQVTLILPVAHRNDR